MQSTLKDSNITVNEILQSPFFKNAKIIAGRSGINRYVKWIHILDAQIFVSLTGNEFILSTGSVFTDLENGISFLKHLIEHKVSGLAIELVSYITSIPDEMMQIADENNFPLFVFTDPVNFMDITLDLHTKIITKNQVSFFRLEKYIEQLDQVLLSPHDTDDILDCINNFLGINAAYIPAEGKAIFRPFLSPIEQKEYINLFNNLMVSEDMVNGLNIVHDNIYVASRRIAALEYEMGQIFIYSGDPITEFESLILEKTAVAVSQDLLRDLFTKEKKKHQDSFWIKDWLNDRINEKEILQLLDDREEIGGISGCVVCIVECSSKASPQKNLDKFLMHTALFLRPLFEQEGFSTLSTYENNKIFYVLMNKGSRETWKKRAMCVVNQFKARRNPLLEGFHLSIGVGRMIDRFTDVNKSFKTAQESINIQKRIKCEESMYDLLHVYRLVSRVDNMGSLNEYIQDYLTPVIQYDQKHNAELIKTLQVYYECNGSKQRTAERLFIVRQTLYLRIQKLEELLGADFMNPEKRLIIEFSLYAYQYMQAGGNAYKI